jgi:aspartyl-tRNA(Asn)/glutamyl-tRNA(Gln) amidotransferase subunit C
MVVTKEQVSHLGWLSRIELSDEELERNTGQIEQIIKYLDKLDSITLNETDAIVVKKDFSELRDDIPVEFGSDPLGTAHRKDGYVKGPRMT